MTSTEPHPSTADRPADVGESRASRASRPPLPVADERWLGDPWPDALAHPSRRPQGFGSIAAVGAVVLTSVVGMNALQGSAGAADQRGGPGGFGGAPNGAAPTGGFGGPGSFTGAAPPAA